MKSLVLLSALLVILLASAISASSPSEFDSQMNLSAMDGILASGAAFSYPDMEEKGVSFFRNTFGLDVSNAGTRLPPTATYSVVTFSGYKVDSAKMKGFPTVAGAQDLYMEDNAFYIIFNQPTVLHGTFGGRNGTWVGGNSWLTFGYYTMKWASNNTVAFPRINFFSLMPMFFGPDGSSVIDCALNSNLWGRGFAKGILMPRTNAAGVTVTTLLVSHTYPAELTTIAPKCAVITSEKDTFEEDFVVKWNNVLLSTIRDMKVVPPIAARAMAMVHSAIDDALDDCKNSRYSNSRKCSKASLVSAISHAAHRVLMSLFPTHADCFNSALQRALQCKGCENTEVAIARGKRSGVQSADRVLRSRDDDGSQEFVAYEFGTNPMDFQPVWPGYSRSPLLPQWPKVTPFAITDPADYRQGAPPAMGTPEFETDYQEVFTYGRNESSVRTFDQRRVAWFWEDGPGTATPPGHWNVILQSLIRQRNITDTFKVSALFHLLGVAVADAGIVSWDHKYFYNTFRPETAIKQRDRISGWFPFLNPTPNFPEYTSGHSTFSAAAARVLSLAFGTDDITFETSSDGYPNHIRKFNRLSDASKEAGKSRIYGGIHFEYANKAGFNSGVAVGNTVYTRLCRNGSCLE